MPRSVDVLVIGGGAAGLSAAHALHAQGIAAVVLEGRPRLGGRIFTHREPGVALPIELGAEFVHGAVPDTLRIADDAGLLLCEVAGEWWRAVEGALHREPDVESIAGQVLGRLDPERTPDRSYEAFLREILREDPSLAAAAQRATRYVEGFEGADPARVGERWLALAVEASRRDHQDRQFRFAAGYDGIVRALAESIPADAVHLSTVVHEIEWHRGRVSARAGTDCFEGRAAIVTVPLAVLAATPDGTPGPITFRPELDGPTRRALAGLAMGSAARLVLGFGEPFWETLRSRDGGANADALGFLSTDDPHFPIWWTTYPLRAPLLTAWAGGPRAATLARLDPAALRDQALAALSRAVGIPRSRIERLVRGAWSHDWEHDPLSRGAYSYGIVGGVGAPAVLNRPIDDTLFLAGEHTDPDGRTGTVHGAIASGRRAAEAVRRALGAG